MAFKVDKSGGNGINYERIGEGQELGIVSQLIDFGMQHRTNWKNQKPQYFKIDDDGKRMKSGNDFIMTDEETSHPDIKHVIFVTFELPNATIDIDGDIKPRWISKEIVVSSHEKSAMRKWNTAIMGVDEESFDLMEWIGRGVSITIGTTSGGKDKISQVSGLLKGTPVPALQNPSKVFDVESPDMGIFGKLPEFMQNKIISAKNWKGGTPSSGDGEQLGDDEPPF